MSDRTFSRRRFFTFVAGASVGALGVALLAPSFSMAPPYPPIIIPQGVGSLMHTRLLKLHARYGALRVSQGVAAVRMRVLADLRGLQGDDEWLASVVEWIEIAGRLDAADLMIDAAEIGGDGVRRNVASYLAARTSPLLMANGYGPRIIRLSTHETDAAAAFDWRDLRTQLGI